MGQAKEAMIAEEDRLHLVERQKEEAEMEADKAHEAEEKTKEMFESLKMYFTIYEYECAEQLGLFENIIYETSITSFHKLIEWILQNPKAVTDTLFADEQIVPISFSTHKADIEVIAKTNSFPIEDEFDFDAMKQEQGDNGFHSLVNEKDEEVKLSVEEDQVLINHQASEIERLQKEIAELKK